MSIRIGIGRNLQVVGTPIGDNYDPDIATYLNGLVTPLSDGHITLLQDFVVGVKSDLGITNLSDAFDWMEILANETSEAGLRNIVKRAHDGVVGGTPAFVALEGYTAGAIGDHIDVNYNPFTQGVNYQLNDASIGIYVRTLDVATLNIYSTYDGADIANMHASNGAVADRVYLNSNNYAPGVIVQAAGMMIKSREDGTTCWNYCNGDTVSGVRASTNIPNTNVILLADTALTDYSRAQLSMAFGGRHFSTAEKDFITARFETYMDANGKGVIP